MRFVDLFATTNPTISKTIPNPKAIAAPSIAAQNKETPIVIATTELNKIWDPNLRPVEESLKP